MKSFRLSLQFPSGTVLVGGYSAVPDGLHAVHAQDENGSPVIPSTAIRGALRETLESLLRGAGEQACSGGDGVLPGQEAAAVPCVLDQAAQGMPALRCKACRLFGTARTGLEPGERAFSGLVVEQALLPPGTPFEWTKRPGVSIARRARSAENQRLYLQRVPLIGDAAFVAKGQLVDLSLEHLLRVAVENTTHIGAGRSRGLARVQMKLEWAAEPDVEHELFPSSGDVRLRVTLLSPASIGVPVVSENLRESRREIPGAALRGAIGFTLAKTLSNPEEESFQRLVATDGAQFGFLYPAPAELDKEAGPLPITAAACKHHRESHGVVDTLLERIAMAHVTDSTQAIQVRALRVHTCFCGGPLHGITGARNNPAKLKTRTITRVAMDRARRSARDEKLFSLSMIDTGAVFEGTVRNIPITGRSHLRQALSQRLSLGRGHSAGYGRVRVEVLEVANCEALEARAEKFDDALTKLLRAAQLPQNRIGRLVPITLMSPLLSTTGPEQDDGAALLITALPGSACFLRARRFSREGGWDQRAGTMQPALATAAGGVFVIELRQHWREVLHLLHKLEQQGIGERRCQGYGQLRCFDPFILSRTLTR